MNLKQNIINGIIEVEGGYVNDPSDSGGETNYGITVKVARKSGYTGDMRELPRSTAYRIYETKFWDKLSLDDIVDMSEEIAEEIADTGVNMGTKRAAIFLQRSLSVLNNRGQMFDDVTVDGRIGTETLDALASYLNHRSKTGGTVLCRMLNCLQGAFYVELAERREKDEKFITGWFRNRVK